MFSRREKSTPSEPRWWIETGLILVVGLCAAWIIQAQVAKPYVVPSGSMKNTLQCGDRIVADRLSVHWSGYHHKDVVVFHPPAGAESETSVPLTPEAAVEQAKHDPKPLDLTYVKRLIGMPGDTVEVKGGVAYVNGKRQDEPYLHPSSNLSANWGPVKVPQGHYLMLGDNRAWSADGRFFGFVPKSYLIGRARLVYWPLNHAGRIGNGSRASSDQSDGSRCT